jgi:hypothetical protein
VERGVSVRSEEEREGRENEVYSPLPSYLIPTAQPSLIYTRSAADMAFIAAGQRGLSGSFL